MGDATYSYGARGNHVLAQRPGGSHINPNHRHIRYTLEDQAHDMVQGRLEIPRTSGRFWPNRAFKLATNVLFPRLNTSI